MSIVFFTLLCVPFFLKASGQLEATQENTEGFYRTDIRVCPKCNHRNKITDRYCKRCGRALKK